MILAIKWAPQHASIATTQDGILAVNLIAPSRVVRLRTITAPAASSPAKLTLFSPKSIPRMAMICSDIGSSSQDPVPA